MSARSNINVRIKLIVLHVSIDDPIGKAQTALFVSPKIKNDPPQRRGQDSHGSFFDSLIFSFHWRLCYTPRSPTISPS